MKQIILKYKCGCELTQRYLPSVSERALHAKIEYAKLKDCPKCKELLLQKLSSI